MNNSLFSFLITLQHHTSICLSHICNAGIPDNSLPMLTLLGFSIQMPRIYSGNSEHTCVITWSYVDALPCKQVLFTLGCIVSNSELLKDKTPLSSEPYILVGEDDNT